MASVFLPHFAITSWLCFSLCISCYSFCF